MAEKKENENNDIYIKKISDNPIKKDTLEKDALGLGIIAPFPYAPIYTLGYDKIEFVPRRVTVKLSFYCPTCSAEFAVERPRFMTTDKMTCFCGTKLKFDKPESCWRTKDFYEIA